MSWSSSEWVQFTGDDGKLIDERPENGFIATVNDIRQSLK